MKLKRGPELWSTNVKLYKVSNAVVGSGSWCMQCIRIHLDKARISAYCADSMTGIMYYVWKAKGGEIECPDNEIRVDENLVGLSEEEMFQKSLVWDYPVDIFLLKRVQEFLKDNLPERDDYYKEWYQTFGED